MSGCSAQNSSIWRIPIFPQRRQFAVYKEAAQLCPKEVTIRTLDIGGDRSLPYYEFEPEENPFLGWRAIRISLDMPDLFCTQLRAILRASAFGHIRIMFPMMISVEELVQAKEMVEKCKEELRKEQAAFDEDVEMGMMMETPASVLLAEDFAREADFFSIGTNDLTQYILAVDRGNKRIASRYDSFHPAMWKAIAAIICAGHKYNRKVGMCGELVGYLPFGMLAGKYRCCLSCSCIRKVYNHIILEERIQNGGEHGEGKREIYASFGKRIPYQAGGVPGNYQSERYLESSQGHGTFYERPSWGI